MIAAVTPYILPSILLLFGISCLLSRRNMSDIFLAGAGQGLRSAARLLPTLILLMTAVQMFSASGAADCLSRLLAPLFAKIGIPPSLTSLILVRPFSGSGSTALLRDIFATEGADSFAARCAAVLSASSDTIFYVIPVYFSAAGVKNGRHTIPSALFIAIIAPILACIAIRIIE